jgi:hypothetical protein
MVAKVSQRWEFRAAIALKIASFDAWNAQNTIYTEESPKF